MVPPEFETKGIRQNFGLRFMQWLYLA
jgi:hypothetical protein